ncbi:HAD-IC family P-type ATPase [Streptomyces alkaliterrae]|uniref:HAD-IC family P-type ATPase n=1 Tax=Streptomyces alkaliterrae TaxID=2213162 RepID=A0A5P0YY92_9ACTN|nr:HAD-IC family P-type ATPase [Streptomyces alkaliterrae]MBB1255446.1 HAD-IC family P-type ATPase [Streptomyces alkaliterrae]MBB1259968.1 HAD-IC family P-type ATPase [Streptomyces alkaliterrae]MQS03409.1 HAD-IC family P-type ATPase [Streptomyces alkaliterrae]
MSERLETVDELEGSPTRSVTGETVPAARGQGLDAGQVAARVEAGQVNDVPSRSSRSLGEIVRANLFTRINAIIGVLFVIILIVGPIQDALFGGVILANTVIGIIQEVRAKRTLDELAIVGETRPSVWRDGVLVSLSASEVVRDDVIELGPGDKIVVDGAVIGSDNLEVDESLLTGEADPVVKEPGDTVMSGSFVVAGTGAFATTRVGKDAYAAQLAEEAKRFTLVNSELRQGISTILKYVTYVIIPAGIALIISQLMINDGDLPEAIRRMVGGLVPMVPEGLVLLTSIAFAVGVVRLGKKQCLVQELPAIEGLARVDTVCLDKTGTLTEASMDVEGVHPVTSGEPGDAGDAGDAGDEARLAEVLGALGTSDERPNASMQAIIDRYPAPEGWSVEDSAPFSSARKWSGATLTDNAGDTRTWLLGAPDVLLPAGHPALADADAYGGQGLRVLLLARCSTPLDVLLAEPSAAPGAATPAALVVIKQRIRPEAPETLRYFADQGVDTKVISGDNALSVGAVARGLDLRGAEHPVDARGLPDAEREPEALADKVEQNTIFGRVGPQQKRDMVAALQSRGHTVAMTGDGVNDVLALKDADIAVAMGSGSPASRGVAQIVLLNNNFSTLPSVVAEGRRVIGNIERVANLFLTKTVYSALLAIIVVLAQVPYPFLPRHLTLIGSLSIGIPAFFLALAPNKERARSNFVGRVLRFAIPAGALAAVATFSAYLMARGVYDDNLEAETSVACLTLFLVALWALAIIARPYTWWRLLLVGTMAFAFAVVLTVPFLQEFFQISLVGTQAPLTAVGIAVAAGVTLEILWAYLRRQVTAD